MLGCLLVGHQLTLVASRLFAPFIGRVVVIVPHRRELVVDPVHLGMPFTPLGLMILTNAGDLVAQHHLTLETFLVPLFGFLVPLVGGCELAVDPSFKAIAALGPAVE